LAQLIAREIRVVATRSWKVIDVCGGRARSIINNGIDQGLPA
jgi:hydrogenase maturation factor